MLSKQKFQCEGQNNSSLSQDPATLQRYRPAEEKHESSHETDDEACPVCQEKLNNRKMVFQCGHVICCNCKFHRT